MLHILHISEFTQFCHYLFLILSSSDSFGSVFQVLLPCRNARWLYRAGFGTKRSISFVIKLHEWDLIRMYRRPYVFFPKMQERVDSGMIRINTNGKINFVFSCFLLIAANAGNKSFYFVFS